MASGRAMQKLDSSDSSEYLTRAAFFTIRKIIGMAHGLFAQPDSTLVIGIRGGGPFGAYPRRIGADRKSKGRGFAVRRVKLERDFKIAGTGKPSVCTFVGKRTHRVG